MAIQPSLVAHFRFKTALGRVGAETCAEAHRDGPRKTAERPANGAHFDGGNNRGRAFQYALSSPVTVASRDIGKENYRSSARCRRRSRPRCRIEDVSRAALAILILAPPRSPTLSPPDTAARNCILKPVIRRTTRGLRSRPIVPFCSFSKHPVRETT